MTEIIDQPYCLHFNNDDLKKILNRSQKEFEAICLMDESVKIAIGMATLCEIIAANSEYENESNHSEPLSGQAIANLNTFAGAVINLLKCKVEDFSSTIKQ